MKNTEIMKINSIAAEFYHYILVSTKAGQAAMKYLHSRKVNDATIDAYHLGWAPKKSCLVNYLKKHGYSSIQIRQTGLAAEGKNGVLYDRFFSRIMYPIDDRYGNVIAFSGRVLNKADSDAKYLNVPETPLFHKRNTIFNLDKAMKSIKDYDHVILVEGYMDVISAYQAGVKNVIASMGTSLTKPQINKIKALTHNITVCYDGDKPGQDAIARALRILAGSGVRRSAIQMPKGIDPDEYRRKYGNDSFRIYINTKVEPTASFWLNYWASQIRKGNTLSELGFMDKAVRLISGFTEPRYCYNLYSALQKQAYYVQRLSNMYDTPATDIYTDVVGDNLHDAHSLRRVIRRAEHDLVNLLIRKPKVLANADFTQVRLSSAYTDFLTTLQAIARRYGSVAPKTVTNLAKRFHVARYFKKPQTQFKFGMMVDLLAYYINHAQYVQAVNDNLYANLRAARKAHDDKLVYEITGRLNMIAKAHA